MGDGMVIEEVSEAFHLMSNKRRAGVVVALAERGSLELGDLCELLASYENGKEVQQLTNEERERVYTSLYQTHLPKMKEAGIVEYDRPSGTIQLGDRGDIYFDFIRNHIFDEAKDTEELEAGNSEAVVRGYLRVPFELLVPTGASRLDVEQKASDKLLADDAQVSEIDVVDWL